jgi:hypothetical protein
VTALIGGGDRDSDRVRLERVLAGFALVLDRDELGAPDAALVDSTHGRTLTRPRRPGRHSVAGRSTGSGRGARTPSRRSRTRRPSA